MLDRIKQKVLRFMRPPDTQIRGMYVGGQRVLLKTKAGPLLAASDDLGIMPSLALFGTFEDELANWLTETLVEGDTFVDVGANIGWFTMIGAKRVGRSGKVVAVEADRRNFELLLDNLSMNYVAANTDAVLAAAAANAGTITLYQSGSFRGSSSTVPFSMEHRRAFPGEHVEAVEVPAVVLDDLLEPYGRIAVLKMDIEGGEAAALYGLRRLLDLGRIEKLVLEINKDSAGAEWEDFISWLYDAERAGWNMYDLAGGTSLSVQKAVEVGWYHAVVLSR